MSSAMTRIKPLLFGFRNKIERGYESVISSFSFGISNPAREYKSFRAEMRSLGKPFKSSCEKFLKTEVLYKIKMHKI